MPLSALPERLQNPDAWKGTDLDNPFQRWIIKYIHGWFAYGPRAKEWWGRWREWPKTLVVFSHSDITEKLRIESEGLERDSAVEWFYPTGNYYNCTWSHQIGNMPVQQGYLSRIQYYTRWHFQIQWPFMISFHFYFRSKDVPVFGLSRHNTDNKLFYCYFGAHRDSDKVYWFPSAFVGLTWK